MKLRSMGWAGLLVASAIAACSSPDRVPASEPVHALRGELKLEDCDADDPAKQCSPRLDQVFMKNTHNSYWVNKHPGDDAFGAGPQQRIWDQLVHEHVRSIEVDLHKDIDIPATNQGYHPGEFRIYHTNQTENSTTFSLADLLQVLQRFDYAVPNHELVHISIEFKQVDRFGSDDSLFDAASFISDFHPEDLDRVLWEHLGSHLYTPGEYLSQCDGHANIRTLRDCSAQDYARWPTIDELRGRYLVTVHGTDVGSSPGATNERAWWMYAGGDGDYRVDIRTRAAFPMFVVGGGEHDYDNHLPYQRAGKYHTYTDQFLAIWRRALDNTIIWDLEDIDSNGNTPSPEFIEDATHVPIWKRYHGLVRTGATHMIDFPMPSCSDCSDIVGHFPQVAAIRHGWQILMTDFPANHISDFRWRIEGDQPIIPSRVDHPYFEGYDVGEGDKRHFPIDTMREPGQRIYFDTATRVIDAHAAGDHSPPRFSYDRFNLENTTRESDFHKRGSGQLLRVAGARASEPVDDWEVFPSTSMETHTDSLIGFHQKLLQLTPFGRSCFVAENQPSAMTQPDGEWLQLCRVVHSDNERSVSITLTGHSRVEGNLIESWQLDPHLVQGESKGEALRVYIDRHNEGSTVLLMSAAEMNPDGTPGWQGLPRSSLRFGSDLVRQGLLQEGAGVFVGTRLNYAPVDFADFRLVSPGDENIPGGHAYDLSYCGADGSACAARAHAPRELVSMADGEYVRVHQATGKLFRGQERTIYTTNRYEMRSSGFYELAESKFLLRTSPADASWAPVYHCVDWRRDMHIHYLSTSPACDNNGDDHGKPYGGPDYLPDGPGGPQRVMGYLSRVPRAGFQPVYHMRTDTENATGESRTPTHDTHDHVFAVGDADKHGWEQRGYSPYGDVFGYVAVTTTATGLVIDATALTKQPIAVAGVSEMFDSDVVKVLQVEPGPATIYVASQGAYLGQFIVGADGKVDYDASLDGTYGGRGTNRLIVKAYPVTVDGRALTRQPIAVAGVGPMFQSDEVTRLMLPPGPATIYVASQGAYLGGFTVRSDATIGYDTSLDGTYGGRDSGLLTLKAYSVTVDGRALTRQPIAFAGVGPIFNSDVVTTVKLPPGPAAIYVASQGAYLGGFTVRSDATIGFDASLDGTYGGRGRSLLPTKAYPIPVDATALSAQPIAVAGVSEMFDSGVVLTVKLPPGPATIYVASRAAYLGVFAVKSNGTIDFDASLDAIYSGRASTMLRVLRLP